MELEHGRMLQAKQTDITATGRTDIWKARANTFGTTAVHILGAGSIRRFMGRAFISTKTVLHTKAHFLTTKCMGKEF